jgi:hypothetical protein
MATPADLCAVLTRWQPALFPATEELLDGRAYCCSNEFISCDADSKITKLSIQSKLAQGSLTDRINDFVDLKEISLLSSNFNGKIPWQKLSLLPKLETLILDYNKFSGALSPFTSPALKELSVAGNTITGAIPDLSQLKSLESLNLSNNRLEGPIPDSLAQLTKSTNYLSFFLHLICSAHFKFG